MTQNPINYVADNPNNIFEQAKKAVGEKVSGFMSSDAGNTAMQKASPVLSALNWAAKPYRDYVAPALSATLLELNANYREQNKNLGFVEQVRHAFDLSKSQVSGRDETRRAISPGRAFTGLIGSAFDGSSYDKINWSNTQEVDKFFNSGSAQFWSGVADLGFNFLDPVTLATGGVTSVTRKALLTRPVGSKFGRVDILSKDLDRGVMDAADKTNPANAIFEHIEKDPTNIRHIQGLNLASASTNPVAYATMLSTAYTAGGRQLTADVIKASIGDIKTLERLRVENSKLATLLDENANNKAVVEREIKNLTRTFQKSESYTPDEVANHLAMKEELTKNLDKIAEEEKKVAAKTVAIDVLQKEELRPTITWSRSYKVEQLRNAVAAANIDGHFLEATGGSNRKLVAEVAKSLGTSTPYARAMMWVSPTQQLREHPAGLAFLGGAAGEASYKEFDARVSKLGTLFGMSKDEMTNLSNSYRALSSKSERFNAFENLLTRSFELLVEKHYGKKLGALDADKAEAITALVRGLVDNTVAAQRKEINLLLDKNYTVTDNAGNIFAQKHMEDFVNKQALERAMERGESKATPEDIRVIEQSMRQNALLETQVPYMHFGVDLDHFDRVMAENPTLLGRMVDGIARGEKKAVDVRNDLDSAARTALLSTDPTSAKDLKAVAATAKDAVIEGLDSYYTYVWKPFTLLSFKYTSRNLFEGYLRVFASMIDMNSHYGYGWTDMFGFRRNPGAVSRSFQNIGYRVSGVKSRKEFSSKVAEIQKRENLLSSQLKKTPQVGINIAQKTKFSLLDAADKETFIANDGMSMSLMYIKSQLKAATKYVNGGNTSVDSIADILKNDVLPAVYAEGKDYGSDAGNVFINHIVNGEYSNANELQKISKSTDIVNAIHKYRDEIDEAYSKIMDIQHNAATGIEYSLENIRFAMSRFIQHSSDTMMLLSEKAVLNNELADIAPKGKLRKSHSGVEQMEIYPGVWIDKAFAGEAGDMLRKATSSHASTTRTMMGERQITGFGLLSNGSVRTMVESTDPAWLMAHTDYVNNDMMKDAVIRHMVELIANGINPDNVVRDTINWVKISKDPELGQWKREVKQNMTGMQEAQSAKYGYEEQVIQSYTQILQHLPIQSDIPGVVYNGLHEKALKGFTEQDSARIALSERVPVTSNLETKNRHITTAYKNMVSTIFKFIGTMPEDSLVRHPFFNMIHDAEINRIVKMYENYGKKNNMSTEEIQKLVQDNSTRIKTAGVNRAYKELMNRLYSIERYTSPGRLMRFVAPFYMAQQNTSRFWIGVSLRNPQIAYDMAKAYNAPYRAGVVYDENGNQVSGGTPWDAEANKDRVLMPTPSFLRKFPGMGNVKDTLTMSPSNFDVVTQGQWFVIPTAGGPVGEIGAQEVVKWAAKNTSADSFLKQKFGVSLDEFTRQHILPYYEKTYGESIAHNVSNSFMPFNSGTVSLLAYVYGSTGRMPFGGNLVHGTVDLIPGIQGRWETRFATAREEVTAKMLMNGDPLIENKINEEAIKIAASSLLAEGALKLSPTVAAFQPVDKQMQELNGRMSQLQTALGYNEGNIAFVRSLERQGAFNASGVAAVMRASTVDNKFGLNANLATIRGVQANSDAFSNAAFYFQDNPFLGQLFNQKYGEYSNVANELMFSTTINGNPLKSRNLSASDADHQAQVSAAWAEYFKNIQYIEDDAKRNGIEPSTDAYDAYYTPWKERVVEAIGKQFPSFETRQMTITLHKSDAYVQLAKYFLEDQKFMSTVGKNNNTILGLKAYIEGRQEIVDSLEISRKLTGTQGVDTKANRKYLLWKERMAQAIIKDYPEFQQMYDRYFVKDELNNVSSQLKGFE